MDFNLSLFDKFILNHKQDLIKDDWNDIFEKYDLSIDMIRIIQNKLNWGKNR